MKTIKAADVARELGIDARRARIILRAAGIRAPYTSKAHIVKALKQA